MCHPAPLPLINMYKSVIIMVTLFAAVVNFRIRSDGLFSIGNLCFALLSAQLAFAGAENAFPVQVSLSLYSSRGVEVFARNVHITS